MIDERFLFGAFGMNETDQGPINLAYWFPGSETSARRYHPIRDGLRQEYEVGFRFGKDQTYHNFYRGAWRWGWDVLAPKADHYDMAVVQRSLVNHLAGLAITYEDRTGIPFWTSMITGENFGDAGLRDRDAVMGFVGKDLEGAAMLMYAATEDETARGEALHQLGIDIIDSMVRYVEMAPPSGSGFNIETGKPSMTNPAPNHVPCCNGRMYLRAFTDDMRWVLKAYQWELERGVEHYEWFRWCTEFAQWLLLNHQHPDGGFPRSWYPGTNQVYDDNYESSYNAMAFLTKLSEVTGGATFWTAHGRDPFLTAAIEAGEFCWRNFHSKEQYVGGTLDNNNILDKEAGTLSLEGYLALYEATKDSKWLDRAKAAADFAETWIYTWNVPMPDDQADADLQWKREASTIGVNRINSQSSGVDQWMAGDVDEYAKLYVYTQDPHYLEVARILLHNSKNMLALPGRMYDLYEPGAQQEHWSISRRRGYARHRGALPWVTVNHLTGILALKEYDTDLFEKLAGPADQ
jgi:hypothetical protein